MEADVCRRGAAVKEEYDFLCSHGDFYTVLQKADLPLRVTHNDTKLNNVLFDEKTGRALLAIDLDTVMPGYAATDFGDAIRAGASKDGKLDTGLFAAFTKGFLEGVQGSLSQAEIALLPDAARLITLELAMRFLTDYLQGDTYFKIKYPTHNLERAKEQIALAQDMAGKMEHMRKILADIHAELFAGGKKN